MTHGGTVHIMTVILPRSNYYILLNHCLLSRSC